MMFKSESIVFGHKRSLLCDMFVLVGDMSGWRQPGQLIHIDDILLCETMCECSHMVCHVCVAR